MELEVRNGKLGDSSVYVVIEKNDVVVEVKGSHGGKGKGEEFGQ